VIFRQGLVKGAGEARPGCGAIAAAPAGAALSAHRYAMPVTVADVTVLPFLTCPPETGRI
jgi:hypothetical protein